MDEYARILVIEDDAGFRDLLRINLSIAGYAVQIAEDGIAGGQALLAQPPDLVLSDLNMPHLDGFALLALLRSEPRLASIPVILLSGRTDTEAKARALQLGVADFLTKPVTRAALLESVRNCLSKSEQKRTPPD
jgi:DNA-binding response OmpR family regulator